MREIRLVTWQGQRTDGGEPEVANIPWGIPICLALTPVRSVSQARKLGCEVKEIAWIGSLRKTELGVSQGKGPGLEEGA